MKKIVNMSRRDFLKAGALLGGGLVLGFYVPLGRGLSLAEAPADFAPNAFLRIAPDSSVTVIVPQSEMGQGVLTSLPMLVAEELDANWKTVKIEQAPAAKVYANRLAGMQLTGGSTSIRAFWKPLRQAGAAARTMLISAAAGTWKVDAGSCRAESSNVVYLPTGRKIPYGDLVEKAAALPVPRTVRLKPPRDFKLLGKPTRRLDTPSKVNGTGVFGLDVKLPGMLVATVSRCPVFGGKVSSCDDRDATRVPGVKHIVPIESGVAVVADTYWAAKTGRDALLIKWDGGALTNLTSAGIDRLYRAAARQTGPAARNDGNAVKAIETSTRKIEAVYRVPYLAHATMEPMNCTASVTRTGCEIWAPTQAQTLAQRVAAQLTGFSPDSIVVHTTLLGGGFGRRAEQDFLAEAVQISKAVGAPVKVVWSREDDIQHDHYRPATYNELKAGLDGKGMPAGWMHRIVGPSLFAAHAAFGIKLTGIDRTSVEGAADLFYDIPNMRVEYVREEPGIPVGFWRSVGHSQNTFIVESFLDEVAAAGGKDPYELRRMLLHKHPRQLNVLETAAIQADWGRPLPQGRYRGIATAQCYDSFIAQVAEVSVANDGTVQVHRVVCAVDCGMNVNPETIEAQVQGGIVFGLTAALKGRILIDRGRAIESNFHDYQLMRINEMPIVEVHIIRNREAPGGMGEVGVPASAPALTNAVFAATGIRVRQLPIRAEMLKKA